MSTSNTFPQSSKKHSKAHNVGGREKKLNLLNYPRNGENQHQVTEVSSTRGNESNGSNLYNGHHFTTVYLSSVHSRKNIFLSTVYQQLQPHLVQLQRRTMKFMGSSQLREPKGVRTESIAFSNVHRITRRDTNVEGREKEARL